MKTSHILSLVWLLMVSVTSAELEKVEVSMRYQGLNDIWLNALKEVKADVREKEVFFPPVVVRENDEAAIEVITESIFPHGGKFKTRNIGLTSKFTVVFEGDVVRLYGSIILRRPIYAPDGEKHFSSYETREIHFDEKILNGTRRKVSGTDSKENQEFLIIAVNPPKDDKAEQESIVEQE